MSISSVSRTGRRRRRALAWMTALILCCGVAAGVWYAYPRGPLVEGQRAYERREYAVAEADAKAAIKLDPKNKDATRLLARALARQGKASQAHRLFQKLGAGELKAEDLYLLSVGLKQAGETDSLRTVLAVAVRDDPKHAEAADALLKIDLQDGHFALAEELGRTLQTLPGWERVGTLGVADAQFGAELYDKAASSYRKALKPSDEAIPRDRLAASRLQAARALLRLGKPDEAARQISLVLQERPEDPEASWLLSRAAVDDPAMKLDRATLSAARAYRDAHPLEPEPAPYVGSGSCARCHADICSTQRHSRHAKTFYLGTQLGKVELPKGPFPDKSVPGVTHELTRDEKDRIKLTTRTKESVKHALIEYALGSGDRGLTPLGRDDAGKIRELRVSFYGDIDGWDRTSGHPSDPGLADIQGPEEGGDRLRICLRCHTTYWPDAMAGKGPTLADRGIGCERCHGPGGRHVAALAATPGDPAILQLKRALPADVSQQVCGQCHNAKNLKISRQDPTAVRFQSETLTWSRCYQESNGQLGCVSCHNPHRDVETDIDYYNAKCLGCHDGRPPKAEEAHVVKGEVCPVNPSTNCVECHMPRTKTAIPHTTFSDHNIRVHREPDAKTIGQ